ncbi:hypothetical protein HW44_11415 [Nitrosococcus oceani]|nr:hypothetical protein HW44_11415 [Nitrosococcus oceani]
MHFTTRHFGWLYLFVTTGFLVFCVGVAISDHGKLRLGAEGEEPEFSFPTWLDMIFPLAWG